jgi:hypothetical protein
MFSSNTSSAAGDANYIEDVFSTYLYTGNSSTQTITNGIDLAGKGGLTIGKIRNLAGGPFQWYDTARGATKVLESSSTAAETTVADGVTAFNSNGITIGANSNINFNTYNFVNWTFRKQPKFFDVVTYTGDGSNRTIAHSLSSVPGCIIVKRTDTTGDWQVYHRSFGTNDVIKLNSTDAAGTSLAMWNNTAPTSTVFSVGTPFAVNQSGGTYVAYLFAHNAGGFGLSGSDNVVSCGSWTGTGSTPGPVVTLGYEPQWVIWKRSDSGTEEWHIRDVMRGMPVTASGKDLYANSSSAEGSTTNEGLIPTATGFQVIGTNSNANTNGGTYIYIAIRRGPMKVPTTGTSVFVPLSRSGTATKISVTSVGFPPDLLLVKERNVARPPAWWDKLRGPNIYINSNNTNGESAAGANNGVSTLDQSGATYNPDIDFAWVNDNFFGDQYQNYFFRRAPGFFDEVCYTGTGVARTVAHNLAAVPELMIVKKRSSSGNWFTYSVTAGNTYYLLLNTNFAKDGPSNDYWNSTTPTASVLSVGTETNVNDSGETFVAYLFATCPGVSKVGSYTGNGSSQTINCGFTGGARFVMIKRTDSTGDWVLWDSSRGMVAGTDPRLALNSTAAEVNANWVYTTTGGFEIVTSDAAVNASGGSYIFLSIA